MKIKAFVFELRHRSDAQCNVQASTFAGSAGQAMSVGAGVVGKQVMSSAGSASRKVGAIIRQVRV